MGHAYGRLDVVTDFINLPRGGAYKQEADGDHRLSALRELVASYSRPLTRYFQRRVVQSQDVPDLVDPPGGSRANEVVRA